MILLYCTNRGQHDRADLCEVHPDGDQRVTVTPLARRPEYRHRGGRSPEPRASFNVSDDRLVLPCTHCRRRPDPSQRRMRQLYDGLIAAGVTEFDLSFLD